MKILCRTTLAFILSAGLCAGASASPPVSDADVSQKLDQLNATAQVIDTRLQQILVQLNQSAQPGVCWQSGKAYSQGAKALMWVAGASVTATCRVQPKTGWPVWEKDDVRVK